MPQRLGEQIRSHRRSAGNAESTLQVPYRALTSTSVQHIITYRPSRPLAPWNRCRKPSHQNIRSSTRCPVKRGHNAVPFPARCRFRSPSKFLARRGWPWAAATTRTQQLPHPPTHPPQLNSSETGGDVGRAKGTIATCTVYTTVPRAGHRWPAGPPGPAKLSRLAWRV